MSRFLGSLNALTAAQPMTITDEDPIRTARPDFLHQRRQFSGRQDGYAWVNLWPRSAMMSGDASAPMTILGGDARDFGAWSPDQRSSRGNGSRKYIMGACRDVDGNAVPGATVVGFLTAGDLLVAETACDDKGNYELPTPYPGAPHYLVAYRTGAPDIAGTSVNTLTPTNRDGS